MTNYSLDKLVFLVLAETHFVIIGNDFLFRRLKKYFPDDNNQKNYEAIGKYFKKCLKGISNAIFIVTQPRKLPAKFYHEIRSVSNVFLFIYAYYNISIRCRSFS